MTQLGRTRLDWCIISPPKGSVFWIRRSRGASKDMLTHVKMLVDVAKGIAETLAYVLAGGFFVFR